MRMILHAKFSPEKFNAVVKDGTVGDKLSHILEEAKPEAVYFTEFDGRRSALMIIDMTDTSQMAFYAEPWFLTFDADVEFHPAMTPADLRKGNLDALAKKWG